MENINCYEFLNSLNPDDFGKTVDLHLHTNCSDGKLSVQETLDKNINKGINILSITDHNTIEAYKNLNFDNVENIKIINGVEFDCWYGYTLLHILGYGIDIENKSLLDICAKKKSSTELDIVRFFNKRNAKDVITAIKNAGGVPVLAHPACCWNVNIKKMIKDLVQMGLEGLEVYYPYKRHRGFIKFYTIKQIKNIADEMGLLLTGGSDSHY
jgi:hypothetical protein